mmetsp:Transcript_11572/g.26741  ORF Transcript_11572/g.26741 Transcript_11572/m.26741 type:complete len:253 (+) Transcript_11572:665-1423(+)
MPTAVIRPRTSWAPCRRLARCRRPRMMCGSLHPSEQPPLLHLPRPSPLPLQPAVAARVPPLPPLGLLRPRAVRASLRVPTTTQRARSGERRGKRAMRTRRLAQVGAWKGTSHSTRESPARSSRRAHPLHSTSACTRRPRRSSSRQQRSSHSSSTSSQARWASALAPSCARPPRRSSRACSLASMRRPRSRCSACLSTKTAAPTCCARGAPPCGATCPLARYSSRCSRGSSPTSSTRRSRSISTSIRSSRRRS